MRNNKQDTTFFKNLKNNKRNNWIKLIKLINQQNNILGRVN